MQRWNGREMVGLIRVDVDVSIQEMNDLSDIFLLSITSYQGSDAHIDGADGDIDGVDEDVFEEVGGSRGSWNIYRQRVNTN